MTVPAHHRAEEAVELEAGAWVCTIGLLISRIRTASIRSGLALETGRASPRRPSTPSTEPLRAAEASQALRTFREDFVEK